MSSKPCKCQQYSIIETADLPVHAPRNARFMRETKWFSTLGGRVYKWLDSSGRDLGDSNAVPINSHGESTEPGDVRNPRDRLLCASCCERLEKQHLRHKTILSKYGDYVDLPRCALQPAGIAVKIDEVTPVNIPSGQYKFIPEAEVSKSLG